MRLISIDGVNMEECTVKEAVDGLSLKNRRVKLQSNRRINPVAGIVTLWKIAPSRNLSSEGTRVVKPPTPSKTIRRRWKRSIHTIILSIRARRLADRRDTAKRVREWLMGKKEEEEEEEENENQPKEQSTYGIVGKAVDIGYQFQVESTIEACAWACALTYIDEGMSSVIESRLRTKVSTGLVKDILQTSVSSEDTRLKEIAKYKRMAVEYKERLEKERMAAFLQEKKENELMKRRMERALERGKEKELLKLQAYQKKREFDRARAHASLRRKAERAANEGNLLAMLRKGASSKIKLGNGVKGLSRHWKKMNKKDRKRFYGIASEKLGLSPVRKNKEKEDKMELPTIGIKDVTDAKVEEESF